jgi:hypothetical protein
MYFDPELHEYDILDDDWVSMAYNVITKPNLVCCLLAQQQRGQVCLCIWI